MKPTTIHEHFAADHQHLEGLFHQFQSLKAADRNNAEKSFREFKAGLERHIAWEEEILFSSFDRRFGHPQGGPTAAVRWEHQQIRQFLDAIALKVARRDFASEEEEMGLEAVLCPHNQKGEGVLYPMIDQVVGEDEPMEIFAAMDRTR